VPVEDVPLSEVRRLVAVANAGRWQRGVQVDASASDSRQAEQKLDELFGTDLFGTDHTLAIYGTLAPGQPNHCIVAPLGGEWAEGVVEGELFGGMGRRPRLSRVSPPCRG
jgi:hypothetical protein